MREELQHVNEVTRLLNAAVDGDQQDVSELLPLVYDQLRKLAAARMKDERPDHTLEATALVHEAYLKLVGKREFGGRRHFLAAASEAMRRILVDAARRRLAAKRGGGMQREDLITSRIYISTPDEDLLSLNTALDQFEAEHPTKAELVKLRYFAGLNAADAASELGISQSTADRYWSYARVWLKRVVSRDA